MKCFVRWSQLENNAVEYRIVDSLRSECLLYGFELEISPWSIEMLLAEELTRNIKTRKSSETSDSPAIEAAGKEGRERGLTAITISFCPKVRKLTADLDQSIWGFTDESLITFIFKLNY